MRKFNGWKSMVVLAEVLLLFLPCGSSLGAATCDAGKTAQETELQALQDWNDNAKWTADICSGAADGGLCRSTHRELTDRIGKLRNLLRSACESSAAPADPIGRNCAASGGKRCFEDLKRADDTLAAGARRIESEMRDFSGRMGNLMVQNAHALELYLKHRNIKEPVLLHSIEASALGRADPGSLRQVALQQASGNYASAAQLYTLANTREVAIKIEAMADGYRSTADSLEARSRELDAKANGFNGSGGNGSSDVTSDKEKSGPELGDLAKLAAAGAPLAAALMPKSSSSSTDGTTQSATGSEAPAASGSAGSESKPSGPEKSQLASSASPDGQSKATPSGKDAGKAASAPGAQGVTYVKPARSPASVAGEPTVSARSAGAPAKSGVTSGGGGGSAPGGALADAAEASGPAGKGGSTAADAAPILPNDDSGHASGGVPASGPVVAGDMKEAEKTLEAILETANGDQPTGGTPAEGAGAAAEVSEPGSIFEILHTAYRRFERSGRFFRDAEKI